MPSFHYTGVTRAGKRVKAVKEALSKQTLLAELSRQGIFVSDIKESSAKDKKHFNLFARKKNLANYFFQLSMLLRNGIPLVEAQNIIAKNTKSSKEREVIIETAAKVSEGVKFSDAIGMHADYYEPMYINLIKAAERVGRLPELLMDISEYEENKKKTKDKLVSAIVYPMVILIMGLMVLTFLLAFIVPKMQNVFATMKQELPAPTKLLLWLSEFVKSYGFFILFIILAAIALFTYLYRTNEKLRYRVDKRIYQFNIVARSAITRYTHILAFQLREGLPLTDSLYYANQTVTNSYFKHVLEDVRSAVQAGTKFSTAVKDASVFPDLFPIAISTGESSGNMAELIERVSAFYSKEIDNLTSTFLSVVEPVLIVFIGVQIAFVVISIMLPLFNINTMVG